MPLCKIWKDFWKLNWSVLASTYRTKRTMEKWKSRSGDQLVSSGARHGVKGNKSTVFLSSFQIEYPWLTFVLEASLVNMIIELMSSQSCFLFPFFICYFSIRSLIVFYGRCFQQLSVCLHRNALQPEHIHSHGYGPVSMEYHMPMWLAWCRRNLIQARSNICKTVHYLLG